MFAKRLSLLIVAATLALGASNASAQTRAGQQETIDKATQTFSNFVRDPNMTWFRNNIGKARGVLIIPTSVKAGFIFGGSGGGGAMLAKSPRTGRWSYPGFYRMGSVTFGLQIGGEVSEIVLLVMTQRGVDALLTDQVKLGGDVSIAVGPVGAGAKGQIADIIAFARTKGVYGGINIEGSVISTHDSGNAAYYGKTVSPTDIFIRRTVRNKGADRFRVAVARAARGRR